MRDIILTVLVNLFLADSTLWYDLWAVIALIMAFTSEGDNLWLMHNIQLNVIIFLIILIIKYLSLPILYNLLEKKSKNKSIQTYIRNLKNNRKLRICILFIPLIFALALFLLGNIYKPFWIMAIQPILISYHDEPIKPMFYFGLSIIYFLFVSWFSSYLVLFLYWDIKKKKLEKKCN